MMEILNWFVEFSGTDILTEVKAIQFGDITDITDIQFRDIIGYSTPVLNKVSNLD